MIQPRRNIGLLAIAMLLAGLPARLPADNAGLMRPVDLADTHDGKTIYHAICQGCHMPDGQGAVGAGRYPALAGNPKLISAPYVAAVVLYGRHNMPAFAPKAQEDSENRFLRGTTLSDAQIAEVVDYVRSRFGPHDGQTLSTADVAALHVSP
jgi:mono/diheme cytochrome c family protein